MPGHAIDAPQIHQPDTLQRAALVANRTMDSTVEFIRSEGFSGGFGEDDAVPTLIGPYECGIGERTGQTERNGASGVENVTEYEIKLPPHANVRNDDRGAVPGFLNQWLPSTAYDFSPSGKPARTFPTAHETGSGPYFELARAGVSGESEPHWPSRAGETVVDGTAVWRWAGILSFFEVIGSNPAESNKAQLVVRVKEISR